jgi:uncharacterized membrane protein
VLCSYQAFWPVCFNWTNAITPGIGRMEDQYFLLAFQNMNRTILNPLFYIVFMGPLLLTFATAYLLKPLTRPGYQLALAASIIYFLGVFMVTLIGNLPLNDVLDTTDLLASSPSDISDLRAGFEDKWNALHLIRTITSSLTFLLLIIISTIIKPSVLPHKH